MNALTIFKSVSEIAVGLGTGTVISNAVKATTPGDIKTYQKVLVFVGSSVISSLVATVASKHVNEQIDTTVEQIKDIKESLTDTDD